MKINNKIKKFLSVIISVSAASMNLLIISAYAETPDIWDGSSDISWYSDSETDFHIETAEQLAGLAQLVNEGSDMNGKSFYLENNIVLNDIANYSDWSVNTPDNNWIPIGITEKTSFNGSFNGQGHLITGLYQHTSDENIGKESKFVGGLFGCIGDTAVLNRIDSQFSYIMLESKQNSDDNFYSYQTTSSYAGGICGYNNGGMIEYSRHSGKIYSLAASKPKISGTATAGGICGRSENGSSITKCINTGEIIASYSSDEYDFSRVYCYSGGICGYSDNSFISECKNSAYVTADAYYEGFCGGICGLNRNTSTVENCINTGNVFASIIDESTKVFSDLPACYAFSGGIVGSSFAKGTDQMGHISNCFSTGAVYAESPIDNSCCGGILGGTDPDYLEFAAEISNSYYLDSTAEKAFGTGESDTLSVSSSEMKTPEFAEKLGAAFSFKDGGYPVLEWTYELPPIKGDLNNDGSITVSDIAVLGKYLLGKDTLEFFNAADLYEDNKIDVYDFILLKKLLI